MNNGQGVLTRPFIAGGWTWTGSWIRPVSALIAFRASPNPRIPSFFFTLHRKGWDYRGEPTPYAWPDVNSHFGIVDLAGYEKDRFWWYQAWYLQPTPTPTLHIFPHWNWNDGDEYPIWAFSNADEVELFVNGVSQGRKAMPKYSHLEWDAVPFAPGSLHAVAYFNGTAAPAAERWVNTTGPSAALRISVKDDLWDGALVAGCADATSVSVDVVDAQGRVNPLADDVVTFTITGDAALAGTSNGDPACLVNNKSPARPAFHGKVAAVVMGGRAAGTVTVTASAPGFAPVSLDIPQIAQPPGWAAKWCHAEARL